MFRSGETIDALEGWYGVELKIYDEIVRSMFRKRFTFLLRKDVDEGVIFRRDDRSCFGEAWWFVIHFLKPQWPIVVRGIDDVGR